MLTARSYAATAGFGVFGGATIPASLIVSPSSREQNRPNDLGQLLHNLLQRMYGEQTITVAKPCITNDCL